jgi:hypothetical protein
MRNILTAIVRRNRNKFLPKDYTNDADFLERYGASDIGQPYDSRKKKTKQTKLGD